MSSIACPALNAWSLATGLLLNDDGHIALDNLIYYDPFDGVALAPAKWGSATGNNGTITVANGYVEVNVPAAADGAMFWYKGVALNPRNTAKWRFRVKFQAIIAEPTPFPILMQDSVEPYCDLYAVTGIGKSLIRQEAYGTIGRYDYIHHDTAAVQRFHIKVAEFALSTDYYMDIDNKGDGRIGLTLYDSNLNKISEMLVSWAGILAEANTMYCLFGEPYTNAWYMKTRYYDFWHYGDYPTTSPVAEMGEITVGAAIEAIPFVEYVDTGASLKYQYNVGAGWNGTWLTLVQLRTLLVGTSPTTLNIRVQFNSDGDANAVFAIEGVFIGCHDYPAVGDVREGTTYDAATKTGTLALPTEVQVEDGVGFGTDGTEYEGTLSGTYNLPLEIVELAGIEVVEV